MKRFFAALLAALMVFSLVTIPAVAEGEVVFEVPSLYQIVHGFECVVILLALFVNLHGPVSPY